MHFTKHLKYFFVFGLENQVIPLVSSFDSDGNEKLSLTVIKNNLAICDQLKHETRSFISEMRAALALYSVCLILTEQVFNS